MSLQNVREGTRFLQFFFVSIVDGLAEVIMSPAFLASSIRKSWISWRLGSAIAVNVCESLEKGEIVDRLALGECCKLPLVQRLQKHPPQPHYAPQSYLITKALALALPWPHLTLGR